MRNEYDRLLRKLQHPIFVVIGCCLPLIMMFTSCNGTVSIQRNDQLVEENAPVAKYSIVFVIHGDGDYLVHDTNGDEFTADELALADAKMVAVMNPEGDVYIFHQKPSAHFLLFFPIHDGEFYYYHNGRLSANEVYWRDDERSNFTREVELYQQFHREFQSEMMSMFLYFGHQVPEFDGKGYDESYPDKSFTVIDLANGLKDFTANSAKFDLLSLATCYGGTPYTISTLGPYAHYIVASPENLHLSYFDLHSMIRLDTSLQVRDMSSFTKRFAQQAFDRLTVEVQTTVSIVVYDMDRVQKLLPDAVTVYERTLLALKNDKTSGIEHCDCAELPEYRLPAMSNGVDIFYRPARFGRSKNILSHSGWECLRQKRSMVENEPPSD